MDAIEGVNGKSLPWEGSNLTATNRRKLGVFKASINQLLSRDPTKRPSMKAFSASCERHFAGTTSYY